jgi:DNA-binding CsgD family transcriptional regulator
MSQKATNIDDVILRIHAAPLEPNGWQSVIQDLLNLCEAEKALMLTVGISPATKPWERTINFDIETLQEYASHWASHDLLYLGAVRSGRVRPGLVSTEQELIDRREYFSSSYFNEFLKPNDIEPQLNVCLTNSMPQYGLGPSAITLYRGVGKESFDEEQASMLRRLAPHLSVAARTTWHIEALGMSEPMYRRALDEIRLPLFALDMTGRLALVNSAGDGLIRAKRWVTVARNTLAAASGLIGSDTFRQALAKLRSGSGTTLLLTDGASRRQAVMTTVPLGSPSPIQVANKRIAGFVWIVPCSPEISPVKSLGLLFQLTPAEILLLQQLADGIHLSDAAGQLHISLNTVRTQLKAIFRKTGQRTQGQLLALANRMAIIRAND